MTKKRKFMSVKKFNKLFLHLLVLPVLTMLFLAAHAGILFAASPPLVYLNDFPSAIEVQPGQPVNIPIFVVGGNCTAVQTELYIWREEGTSIFCLNSSGGWDDAGDDYHNCTPVANLPGLPPYIRLQWTPFDSATYLDDFFVKFCIDDKVDGLPEDVTSSNMFCGTQQVIIAKQSTVKPAQAPADPAPASAPASGMDLHAPSFSFPSAPSSNDGGFGDLYGSGSPAAACTFSSVSISPVNVDLTAYIGDTITSSVTITLTDNCRNYVDGKIVHVPDGVTVDNAGTGRFTVKCDVAGLAQGHYSFDVIEIQDSYGSAYVVPVSVTITDIPKVSDESIPVLTEGWEHFYDIPAGQYLMFRFLAGGPDVTGIQLGNTPYSSQPPTVHLLVKKGSAPTMKDFDSTWSNGAIPSAGLYCYYNIGPQAEFVEIYDYISESAWYYVMLYNKGDRAVQYQRLSLKIMH